MIFAKKETVEELYKQSFTIPVVDAHTHIQDDILDFNEEVAKKNLSGTQATVNKYPDYLIKKAIGQKRLIRRTMMDVTHACFYSWFAQIIEGRRGKLDEIIKVLGDNSESNRKQAGHMLIEELHYSRYSEYAEWLCYMFRLYKDIENIDPLDIKNYDRVYNAVKSQRNDPEFAKKILKEHNIIFYVTSIENRDKIPWDPKEVSVDRVDLSYATHPEVYNMFDANYFIWPEGATDFGLFLAGHKYESEKYLINLEQMLGVTLNSSSQLKSAVKEFLFKILYSPRTNPQSRILYVDMFHPIDFRFNAPYDITKVNSAIRYNKSFLTGDNLKQITMFVTESMLEALNEIGKEYKQNNEEYGCCLQIAIGVTYFMDQSREIQSFPVYQAEIPQEEYSVWLNYPNIHFEYIVANEQLYSDLSNAAKQVGNVSVGPWWHYFRKHKIARMMYDQITMGSISSIASGFTDARFVEMLAAKYQSVRWAVSMALAELADDPFSSIYNRIDKALEIMKEILYINPIKVHHIAELNKGIKEK